MAAKKHMRAKEPTPEKTLCATRKMSERQMQEIGAAVWEGPGAIRFRYGYGPFWNCTRLVLFRHGENFP